MSKLAMLLLITGCHAAIPQAWDLGGADALAKLDAPGVDAGELPDLERPSVDGQTSDLAPSDGPGQDPDPGGQNSDLAASCIPRGASCTTSAQCCGVGAPGTYEQCYTPTKTCCTTWSEACPGGGFRFCVNCGPGPTCGVCP